MRDNDNIINQVAAIQRELLARKGAQPQSANAVSNHVASTTINVTLPYGNNFFRAVATPISPNATVSAGFHSPAQVIMVVGATPDVQIFSFREAGKTNSWILSATNMRDDATTVNTSITAEFFSDFSVSGTIGAA